MNFQDLVLTLQRYWGKKGCLIAQPYDIEKGAATFNPSTFLRALGPEPFNAAFIEPCRRPKDGRYGDNPNRMQHYYQFQVVLKPSPLEILELYLGSLKEIGIDPAEHDIRFVHDDWESPSLGAWGLGWEVWLDGMEITQFTYFQQVGGIDLKPVTGEITYGLERLCMYLQKVDSVFKVKYNGTLTYGDLFHQNEVQSSRYNFEESSVELQSLLFDRSEKECRRLCEADLPIPGFDFCMKASHAFNLLDARGAISVNERQGYIFRVRDLAKLSAESWLKNREALGFPLLPAASPKTESEPGSHTVVMDAPRHSEDATAPLLVELGVEEMPARVFAPLLRDLPDLIEKYLGPTKLDARDIKVFVTPRRIAISIGSIRLKQPDQKLSLKGPPAAMAKDASGSWSKAALGFAQKNGLNPDQIKIQDGYLYAEAERMGREALEILSGVFPKIFSEIHWYKTMRWGNGETASFVRPVAWLTALLGNQVIPMVFAGVESTGRSFGHRFLHNKSVAIKADRQWYLDALRKASVLADQDERKGKIKERIQEALKENHKDEILRWREDEDLLETVTHLVEYPIPVLCSFDPKLLKIPEEVLVSEMREHQKLFALENTSDGALSHFFIAISNMDCKDTANIHEGNERVVRARFADAEFFLREDKKKRLEKHGEGLNGLIFLKDLGAGASMHQKTKRVWKLTEDLAQALGWDKEKIETAKQIADLCKNDLTTQMVGEFPELQGLIGRYYAIEEGLPQIVADGIADHYRPRNSEDDFPETQEGALVGIADRLDTLVAMFGKGKAPTGSADPFALRRASWSTIALLVRCGIRIPLTDLLEEALAFFPQAVISSAEREGLVGRLRDFFRGRAQHMFGEKARAGLPGDIPHDTFEAVARSKAGWENLPDLAERLRALQSFRGDPVFAKIAETFKRVSNILKDAPPGNLEPNKLEHAAEKKLLHVLAGTQTVMNKAIKTGGRSQTLYLIAELQAPVAEFFEAVMVNDPDPDLKRNRQALLRTVREIVLEVADFSAFQET